MLKNKRVLILAPHTDDGELGCGGTIAKLIDLGSEVFYVAFSTAEASVPKGFAPNQLEIEVRQATEKLGIPPENLFVYKYQVRKLNYLRQEILEELINLRPIVQPDIVFLPSSNDIHQDHMTVHNEGIRAFKRSTILGYELIWNNLSFSTDCFIQISRSQLDRKIEALKAYQTQEGKAYMDPKFIESMAIVRGKQIEVPYAEAFEAIRIILEQ